MSGDNEFKVSEWEFISPLNLDICFNNHDGLLWDLMVCYKLRGMPIGYLVQSKDDGFKFKSNHLDKEYTYRMIMSGGNVMFFRRSFK